MEKHAVNKIDSCTIQTIHLTVPIQALARQGIGQKRQMTRSEQLFESIFFSLDDLSLITQAAVMI